MLSFLTPNSLLTFVLVLLFLSFFNHKNRFGDFLLKQFFVIFFHLVQKQQKKYFFCYFAHQTNSNSSLGDLVRQQQYKLDFSGLSGRSTSNARDEEGNSGMQGGDSKGSGTAEAST